MRLSKTEENLKKWYDGNYDEGKETGIWTIYTYDEKIESELYYENGKVAKEVKYNYYPSGTLKSKKWYKNLKLNGTSTDYLENGQKIIVENYIDDELDGLKTHYWDNGHLDSEQEYKNGELHGKSTFYLENGEKRKVEHFKNGELHGKTSQWFKNQDYSKKHSENLKDREYKKDYLSKLSVLSNLKLQRCKGDFCPIDIDKRFDEGIVEVFEYDYPTRTDISNIENETNIVSIFGDSFLYGAGLPREYELGTMLREEYPEVLFPNFSNPGASNNDIITKIEQWTNDEHSNKTKTIIVGLSSIHRFDYYLDSEYPESIDAMNSVHADVDFKMRGYDISPTWEAGRHIESEKDKKTRKRLKKPLEDAQNGIILSQVTYANAFLKNFETVIRRIDWITKQRKWNVIFVRNLSWDESIHEEDMKVINQYFKDMNIKGRQCKVIEMKEYGKWSNIIDTLDCGHWGPETKKTLVQQIKKVYDVL